MKEDEIVEARRAYYREWKAKNRDKVREWNRRYWEKYALRKAEEKKQTEEGIPDDTSTDDGRTNNAN